MRNIDWELLRSQKQTLLVLAQGAYGDVEEHLFGVINLIDQIQDDAVASGEASDSEVFEVGEVPTAAEYAVVVYANLIKVCIEARSHGFATIVWTPDELGDAEPGKVEDRLIELGWDVIEDLGGPSRGSDDDED